MHATTSVSNNTKNNNKTTGFSNKLFPDPKTSVQTLSYQNALVSMIFVTVPRQSYTINNILLRPNCKASPAVLTHRTGHLT